MDTLAAYLPPHPGLLPKWLLLISLIGFGNVVQSYLTLAYTSQVYAGTSPPSSSSSRQSPSSNPSTHPRRHAPVTPLQSRTFGTWTAVQSLVRLYAAYHITDPLLYQLALGVTLVALLHFGAEWLWFGTVRWGRGAAGPLVVSTGSVVWMCWVWGGYVR